MISGTCWSRDARDNNRRNIAGSDWSVLLSLNATAPFDWLLSLSRSPVALAHSAHFRVRLVRDRNAASKMANNPPRFCPFTNMIGKE